MLFPKWKIQISHKDSRKNKARILVNQPAIVVVVIAGELPLDLPLSQDGVPVARVRTLAPRGVPLGKGLQLVPTVLRRGELLTGWN